MGGRIWVESEPGEGSRFRFTARFGRSQNSGGPRRPLEPAVLKDLPVLVVDDNATNRRILEEVLSTWGLAPVTALGGRLALAELHRASGDGEPFRLVLLDAMMPEMDGFMLAEEISRHPELAGAVIMMLSSSDRPGDPERCRQLGVARYLTKPVKQSDLLEAILEALSKDENSRNAAREASQPSDSTSPSPPSSAPLRILLAEDNPVNQKLAVRLLGKRGTRSWWPAPARRSWPLLEQQAFDLVLMDVQMPEMDGLEAAAHIRAREKDTGRHLPIIAMTAHAMKGDRERCLEAGMDGYLAKPIQVGDLFEVIARVVPEASRESLRNTCPGGRWPPEEASHRGQPGTTAVLDLGTASQRVGGDRELLQELAQAFLGDYPKSLARLRAAVTAGDHKTLQRAAHALKGEVGVFGAADAYESAQRLETMGRECTLEGAVEACAALETELLRVRQALTELLPGGKLSSG